MLKVTLTVFAAFLISLGCESADSKTTSSVAAALQTPVDTVPTKELKPYHSIKYTSKELLSAAPGTKSVVFNQEGNRLYAMNLEGMSVYEFDQASRKVLKEFKFKPTPGTGWDYTTNRPIKSFEEKPVEAAMSHNDEILWVSLHNADGIVPIHVKDISKNKKKAGSPQKLLYVKDKTSQKQDSIYVPMIKTGKTPKVISISADNEHLLVSNWHSYNVSVLKLDTAQYPYGKIIATLPVSSIPRGIVIDEKANKSYVSIMGGASLAVINNDTWEKVSDLKVASNPRHVVQDADGNVIVSYNSLAKIASIDPTTGKTLFTASTHAQPRTIILSKNKKFLFVTCYSSNYVDVFKVEKDHFKLVTSLPCAGKPVGVDIFETDDKLEAWVCSYTTGSITVFNFAKE